MQIKTQPSMTVLFSTHETSLRELLKYVGTAVKELYKQVVELDLLITGPQYWFYYGADGKPDTRFTLEIAIPVQGKLPAVLPSNIKQLPPFKCLSAVHEGPWDDLSLLYPKMMQYIGEKGLPLNGIVSEAYQQIDFAAPENNLTEVHIGLI